jgi:hypothetical protein
MLLVLGIILAIIIAWAVITSNHGGPTATGAPPRQRTTTPRITTVSTGPSPIPGRIATVQGTSAPRAGVEGMRLVMHALSGTAKCGWCLGRAADCISEGRGPMREHGPPCNTLACTTCFRENGGCPGRCRNGSQAG